MEHTYKFFVLRYAPNRERGEQVNIGLVVDRGAPDIRLTRDLRKAIALDARRDAGQLFDLEQQAREWTEDAQDFEAVRAALVHFGAVTVSDLGWFKATEAGYEAQVATLMKELVVAPSRPPAKVRGRLNTAIRHLFIKRDLLSSDPLDIRKNKIVEGYPVSAAEHLFADFAYKNGALHFTETVDFRVSETLIRTKFNEVGLKALIATKCKKLHRGSKVYFVYAAAARQDRTITAHLALMDSNSDGLFNFASRQDKAAYLDHSLTAVDHTAIPLKNTASSRHAPARKLVAMGE